MFYYRFYFGVRYFASISKSKSTNINKSTPYLFQYCSDVHVDGSAQNKGILRPVSDTLLMAGDIGNPFCPSFKQFMHQISNQFATIFFVPGNHDHNHGCVYDAVQSAKCRAHIQQLCRPYPNIHILENKAHVFQKDIVVVGTPLYSHLSPKLRLDRQTIEEHNREHAKCVAFIESVCSAHQAKRIVVVSHYVPSFRLIETKYMKYGAAGTKWATDLEHVMEKNPNIKAWVCGHTHSVLEVDIPHGPGHITQCYVNAYGYDYENGNNNDENGNNNENSINEKQNGVIRTKSFLLPTDPSLS